MNRLDIGSDGKESHPPTILYVCNTVGGKNVALPYSYVNVGLGDVTKNMIKIIFPY